MEEITRKVISYCEIPEDLTDDSFLTDYSPDCYVSYTLDDSDEIATWIIKEYPELKLGEIIFINIDY